MSCRRKLWTPEAAGPLRTRIPFRILTAAVCALVLLGISLFVYSPLHRDDPMAGTPCPFCKFQQLSAEAAPAPVQIGLTAQVAWHVGPAARVAHTRYFVSTHPGRAPPPSSFSI